MVNNLILNEDSYMEKKLGREAELYICELISSSHVNRFKTILFSIIIRKLNHTEKRFFTKYTCTSTSSEDSQLVSDKFERKK
ncbi:hypothetical protein BpHYR1_042728 [Brachionus plicatilis]|uniref:Uncharacterized protein n=1 Tax=Brachionus plicatilis TaxID=10195 RepID=A0A3M7T9H2_BRAPC|nr:hypothetical protein BpHYR1_042728 [Brachionus plicatilis]